MRFPNLSKIMLLLTVVIMGGLVYLAYLKWQTPGVQTQADDDFFRLEGTGRRGDDPTYAEEMRQNAAITRETRRKQTELEQTIASLREQMASQAETYGRQLETQIQNLSKQLVQLGENNKTSVQMDADKEAMNRQLEDITRSIASLREEQQRLQQENEEKLNALQAVEKQATDDTSAMPDADAAIRAGIEAVGRSFNPGGSLPVSGASTLPAGSVTRLPDNVEPGVTRPYGRRGRDLSGLQNQEDGGDMFGQAASVLGFRSVPDAQVNQGYLPVSDAGNGNDNSAADTRWKTVFPVYTMPPNTMLTDAMLITPMIGRVPVGREGDVSDPFFFKVEIGHQNLVANGHRIRGLAKMIASGYATGIREQQCVRGYIDSLTFVFIDGRIVSHGKTSSAGTANNEAIGYLGDAWGKPCVRGRYINNAGDYLKSRGLAAFVEAAAEGLSQGQVSYRQNPDGNYSAVLDGNVWQFVFGKGLSGSAGELAEYVRERTANAFDVVYVEQGRPVQIMINRQIPIDYDAKARKVNYYTEPKAAYGYD